MIIFYGRNYGFIKFYFFASFLGLLNIIEVNVLRWWLVFCLVFIILIGMLCWGFLFFVRMVFID